MCDHIEGTRHAGKKNAADQNHMKNDNLTEMWKVDASAIALKLARGQTWFDLLSYKKEDVRADRTLNEAVPCFVLSWKRRGLQMGRILTEQGSSNIRDFAMR